jgi:NH3-dependent NAD+ synthetase/predicted amidohydrolase
MKVAMCQVNPTIGDLSGNLRIMSQSIESVLQHDVSVILFPEMATTGYPPRDLLYREDMWDQQSVIADEIQGILRRSQKQVTAIYGGIDKVRLSNGRYARYNAAYIVDPDQIRVIHKRLLPCYDVFDETRYFVPETGPLTPIKLVGVEGNCDILICEDIWNHNFQGVTWQSPAPYNIDPVSELKGTGPLFVLNASPFWRGKIKTTIDLLQSVQSKIKRPVLWCNQVGAHDDIVTGGYSMAVGQNGLYMLKPFAEDMIIVNVMDNKNVVCHPIDIGFRFPSFGKQIEFQEHFEEWCVYQSLKLHLSDYCRRTGFKDVVLGLSGGIDSALVATIAADVLGSEHVYAITMPSKYSSEGSIKDSEKLAKNLHIRLFNQPIGEIHQSFLDSCLSGGIQKFNNPLTDENIQPRIRMILLMAWSNDHKALLLTTGNKSEISMGYSTLYGDMAGGVAPISDLWKTEVYSLCRFINYYRGEIIPQQIIDKPPSAELRPDQKDTDSLPPYEILDPILESIISNEPIEKTYEIANGANVNKILHQYTISEFKRQQLPIGPKVSLVSYGSGRRIPIAAKVTTI